MERHVVHIGLGSNLGKRLHFLQSALNALHTKVGQVSAISAVYETTAFGFEGPKFYNVCCTLQTTLGPEELLEKLQHIETELGRAQKSIDGYTSRVIDLDILFYENLCLDYSELKIPHPRLRERRFVLQPLCEIAIDFIDPITGKTILELLESCDDKTPIEPTNEELKPPGLSSQFPKLDYLAIEGNIGSGKTSLAHLISSEFNGQLILERFADNPFLPKFYKDPERYAFTLEMSFLADRYQQITEDLGQLSLFKEFLVSDYYVFKSLIFSEITLSQEEFRLYRTLFYQMFKDLPRPNLYVYLFQNSPTLIENIKKRGREYEQEISVDYLNKIQKGYLKFLKNQTDLKVLVLDVSNKDFVKNRKDFIWILSEIDAFLRKT
ncbi:2-amino-4-hydroxy-6-hydroxymethyldihydropteridine diphosphokinase [Winogradskyella aurantiaca]|uniref:2-amino-4-hydroxy-6- hydroxymethyldihydropteridine diphosphokinase n=1 Tax=Winogradskyella aurantiaca TaxID=2219558 RepID=UPI000E1CDD98|nr:2-amino-4-hydroxy-6-hydroxymethyldihydropteridine diphosphokinase [Winogradskyella aurantiaca]